MKKHSFSAMLGDDGTFEVPLDVRALFGEARPAVQLTLLGKTYPTRIMVYGGKYILGIWKAVLASENLSAGDRLKITIEADTTPRVVKPPAELAAALKKNATARAGWQRLSFTHQREWAEAISAAKKPETRERRVAQAIAAAAKKAAARTK
jgi:hypothetical protein